MSLLHDSPDSAVEDRTHRFRAATAARALAEARAELGPLVEIVDANRIRRGGVGGFFATDLGVELIVRAPGEPIEGNPPEHERLVSEYLDTEYLDTEYVDTIPALPTRALPRSSPAADGPKVGTPFSDPVVEAMVPAPTSDGAPHVSTGIDRLLASVTRAERAANGQTAQVPTTFADHLAHHLGGHGPIRTESTMRPDERGPATRVEPAVATPEPINTPNATVERPAQQVETVQQVEAPTAERIETIVADPPGQREQAPPLAPRERTSGSRNSMRKPIDLAAGAVGRLVQQLSDVQPTDGSRMRDLSRLAITVTMPDGTVVEIAAELDGDQHG